MADFSDHKMFQRKRKLTDEELRQLAIEELQLELVKASARAELIGPSGWQPCPLKRTNKRFLTTTIKSAVKHNARTTQKHLQRSSDKLLRLEHKKSRHEREKSKEPKEKKYHRHSSSSSSSSRSTRSEKFGERKHEYTKPEKKKKYKGK
ncbi:hypothetical protein DMENIID0001_001310 [Sergentomyia squamirostris]